MSDIERLRERAEEILVQCGACDAGLPMGCACSNADPRPVIAALLDRLEAAEAAASRWAGVLAECKAADPRWILDRSVTTLETALTELRAALGGESR